MTHKVKDISQKSLLSLNDVFADIANVVLFHGEQRIRPEDLEDAIPFSMYKADGCLHEQERDVAKFWKKEKVIILLAGMENQTKLDRYMPFRIIGYDGAGYRAQVKKKFEPGYPVISIVLYYGRYHWTDSLSLKDHLIIPEGLEDFVNDYKVNLFEVSFFTNEIIQQFHSDFRYVADLYAKLRTDPDYRGSSDELKHADEVLKLISAVSHRAYDELLQRKAEEGEISTMKDLVEEMFDRHDAAHDAAFEEKMTEKGYRNRQEKTAAIMIQDGESDEKIMRYTSLSREDVEKQRRELSMK